MEKTFLEKIKKTETCWIWMGYIKKDGYGEFGRPKGSRQAHRISYEIHIGPIPEGMVIDHLCRNPPCVNPDHLEAVSQKENILRGVGPSAKNAKKTHCPQGHFLDGKNIFGHRFCYTCNRSKKRPYSPDKSQRKYLRAKFKKGLEPVIDFGKKNHCKNGHEFIDDNILIRNGDRLCKTCHKAYHQKYHQIRKEKGLIKKQIYDPERRKKYYEKSKK